MIFTLKFTMFDFEFALVNCKFFPLWLILCGIACLETLEKERVGTLFKWIKFFVCNAAIAYGFATSLHTVADVRYSCMLMFNFTK